jgi:competence protein ComEA
METIVKMGAERATTTRSITRAAMVALAIATAIATPHASAQRRDAPAVAARAASPAPRAASTASAPATGAVTADGVVNIQTASVDELQRLPGIGPSKAAAIVAFRDRTPFRRVEDILRVRGIGRSTFRRLRPMLSVSGPTTLTTDVRVPRSRGGAESEATEGEGEDEAGED